MFGNLTALEGLHVIREIQELKYDLPTHTAYTPSCHVYFKDTQAMLPFTEA